MSDIDEKFGIYFRDPFGTINHAAKYYRLLLPALMLRERYKAAVFVDDERVRKELSIQAAINSDLAVMYNGTGEQIGSIVEVIRAMKAGQEGGEVIHPPSVVYDIDDNLDYVHPFNEAYGRFGTRLPDGSLLEPSGDPDHPTEISTTLASGETVALWQDGVTRLKEGDTFSVMENRRRIDSCHSVAKMCHGVTVPSEALASYYQNVHGCKNVYMFPNTILPRDYHFPNLQPREKEIRVLWQGGMSHYPDWYPLRYAVKAVVDKYPHVKFVIWGTKFDWITTVIPENQLEYHEWTDYAAYKMKRSIMDCDINLAPLVDAPFNWCKSGIKFYEASIGPRPEATLAANVQPYSLEIEDGKTGLLYNSPEEFAQKLGLLIENATLRKNLAAGAKKWVEANRTPDATIPGLAEFYEELRRQRRMEALAI